MKTKIKGMIIRFVPYVYYLLSLALVLYYQRNGLGNDFQTFYSAGKAVNHGNNPWDINKGSEFSAFLNGPVTAIILGLTALFPYNAALFTIRLASVLCLPYLIRYLGEVMNLKIDREYLHLISIAALFTFPVRANLEYGQLAIIFFTTISIALKRELNNSIFLNQFYLGISIYVVLDYKPHVFAPIAVLLFWKRKGMLYGFGTTFLMALLSSSLFTGTFPLYVWLEAIIGRGVNSKSNAEQMSLYSILGLNQPIAWVIAVTLLLYLSWKVIFKSDQTYSSKATFLLITWQALLPFSHPTDLITVLLLPVFLMQTKVSNQKLLVFLATGLAIVWSNNVVISILVIIPILITYSVLANIAIKEQILANIVLLLPQTVFLSIIHESSASENITRRVLDFLAVLLSVLVTIHFTNRKLETTS